VILRAARLAVRSAFQGYILGADKLFKYPNCNRKSRIITSEPRVKARDGLQHQPLIRQAKHLASCEENRSTHSDVRRAQGYIAECFPRKIGYARCTPLVASLLSFTAFFWGVSGSRYLRG
jgi:hypothetical protein